MTTLNKEKAFKNVYENHFAYFARHHLKVIEPETNFSWSWHHEILCHYAEQVYHGDIMNLDINIAPRSLKSLIFNVLFPCWVWTKAPSKKFISGSRSYDLANNFNIKRRHLIESDQYRNYWPLELKDDMNTVKKFENEYGGFMQSVSALGKVVGIGADFVVTDDLLDPIDAFSPSKRKSVNSWYSQALYGRVQNKKTARRININQRLHKEDLSGFIQENYPQFKRLVIPMQMEQEYIDNPLSTVPDFVDPRKAGEFMHPEMYGETEKDAEYKGLGVYGWSSQMQQNPRPIGGGLVKEEWLRRYRSTDELRFMRTVITGDLNFKGKSTSDYVCFQRWGVTANKNKYLIDIIRGKWDYTETKRQFKAFCDKHKYNTLKYIEDKANGPALISDFKDLVPGVLPWPKKGSPYRDASKVERLILCTPEFESGYVYIPEDIELANKFVEELTGFTENGSTTGNDDMVDTATMALLEFKVAASFIES